ncbi:unnamed protein product [Phytomonas sp. EM1]|nr:unnamed protein product [Phytomonas sp. EM1]|eukprot:CCW64794.1 unnamed protein product [Phytomonas sp. isolate EM1]
MFDRGQEYPQSIFQGRFLLTKLIGKGGFGEVYEGIQTSNNDAVAIKMERNTGKPSFLFHEAHVIQDIQKVRSQDGIAAIATLKYYGQEGDYRVIIMTLHGPSLESILEKMKRFSLKTTVMLADQMLTRLEHVHSVGYIHRDLKTDNFLLGKGVNCQRIFLIDFGLSTKYRTSSCGHRELVTGKSFLGTSRFASLNTHKGLSQSRRDDMEQLVYIMTYMYRGRLPWTGLNIKDYDTKEKHIGKLKEQVPVNEICAKCPRQFSYLLFYVRNMAFTETPHYEMCHALLHSILEEMDPPEQIDNIFDWDPRAKEIKKPDSLQDGTPLRINIAEKKTSSQAIDGLANIVSSAKAQGMPSGNGTHNQPQNIVSIGNRE